MYLVAITLVPIGTLSKVEMLAMLLTVLHLLTVVNDSHLSLAVLKTAVVYA